MASEPQAQGAEREPVRVEGSRTGAGCRYRGDGSLSRQVGKLALVARLDRRGRWRWESRHGVSLRDGNPSFDDFAIADAGLPPVKSYRVLITLFVVAIGPLNYWWLRRVGRLHLLLFTVPALALLVSGALLGYAVVADGFDTYLRARSFTHLDQRSGQAVSWARLNYYSGISPSGGLMFGKDTAVLPLERDSFWERRVHALRQVDWTPEQHLSSGWVPSRTPSQYITVRPYACQRQLRVLESSGEKRCAAENLLGTKIHSVMLKSAGGDVYLGRQLEPGARVSLELLADDVRMEQAALKMLGEARKHPLSQPSAAADSVAKVIFGVSSYRPYQGMSDASSTGSLLESGISFAMDEIGSHLTRPRTYVAIVERPVDVVVGTDDVVERQSLHIIFGEW